MARGFTVVELLIVITVMGIIATILISGFPRFGELLAVDREAQLIALAIRDIEQRAVSTLESPIVSGQFRTAFGVHFNIKNKRQYRLFSDAIDQNNFLDAGEEVEVVPIARARIRRICKLDSAGAVCDPPYDDLEQLSVTYKRPNPIIEMRGATVSSCNPGPCVIESLGPGSYMVEIESPRDSSFARRVIMWSTGAVAIKKAP